MLNTEKDNASFYNRGRSELAGTFLMMANVIDTIIQCLKIGTYAQMYLNISLHEKLQIVTVPTYN